MFLVRYNPKYLVQKLLFTINVPTHFCVLLDGTHAYWP